MDIKNFKVHRPVDSSDPGFSIPGGKLRWITGRVRELSGSSGIWQQIKKSQLPEKLIAHIENHYPGAFASGDTIRRGNGELILAYTTNDVATKHRNYLDGLSKEQASRAKIMPKQEHIGNKDFAKITDYEESESSIPSQFLKKNVSE